MIDTIQEVVKKHLGVVIFLGLYFLLLSFKVIVHPTPFYDWDESIYIQVGKEMILHSPIIPLFQGLPWLEKPPLAPFFYGMIQLLPANPEISTRVVSVMLSVAALGLVYAWSLRITKSRMFAVAVSILTAFNPVFFHRAQIVNTDVFLLIGWLGYFLFYKQFWPSFVFLSIGVMSKSILGFYPAVVMLGYEVYLLIVYKKKAAFIKQLKKIALQIGILSLWFLFMLILYKKAFIQVHFEDHLLKRVTKSIESHFGQRTFYLDTVLQEYGWFAFVPFLSIGILTWSFLKKKIDSFTYLLAVSLVPWFLFLNVTKTKIEWYIYPAVTQIVFLILYPAMLLKKMKTIFYFVLFFITAVYVMSVFKPLYSSNYSSYDDNYRLAVSAKKACSTLDILVDQNDRHTHSTLQQLNLLISTSDTYGSHPAMVYYFGKSLTPYYNEELFVRRMHFMPKNSCISVSEEDLQIISNDSKFKLLDQFGEFYLLKRV